MGGEKMDNVLLKIEICLRPQDSSKNYYFPFSIGPDAKELQIDYAYDPKFLADDENADRILEEGFGRYILPENRDEYRRRKSSFKPLVNLLTLSLDSPSGYVGAAHRQNPEQHHWISANDSAPGFCRCPIEPGDWKICLSTHAVVTTKCHVTIIVTECV